VGIKPGKKGSFLAGWLGRVKKNSDPEQFHPTGLGKESTLTSDYLPYSQEANDELVSELKEQVARGKVPSL
jgi:hypothetical protein